MGGFNLGLLLIPVIGGLIIGPIMWRFAPELVGHGIPETLEACQWHQGRIRNRVSVLKVLVSAVTLGSGGSAGREGPGARIGASVGSTVGQTFGLRPDEIRLLLVAGLSGGITATFSAPLGGILFGMEIMYRRIRLPPVIILPLFAACLAGMGVAHVFHDQFVNFAPLYPDFGVRAMTVAASAGLVFGVVSVIWVKMLYSVEGMFDRLPVVNDLKPAIGAVAVGVGGIFLYEYGVMGVGYEGITKALQGGLPVAMLLLLFVVKTVASSFTIGSGGSGGIFAPSLYLGAMIGMCLGKISDFLLLGDPEVIMIAGMAAVFAGAARAPFTSAVLVAEVCGNYALFIPLLAPCLISFLVSSYMLNRASIYTLRPQLKGLHIRPATI